MVKLKARELTVNSVLKLALTGSEARKGMAGPIPRRTTGTIHRTSFLLRENLPVEKKGRRKKRKEKKKVMTTTTKKGGVRRNSEPWQRERCNF